MSKAVRELSVLERRVPLIDRADELLDQVTRLTGKISLRAYELFDGRGRVDGFDVDDWLRAESELLHPVPVEMVETADKIKVRAEVPGFAADDLRLCVEPRRVIVAGTSDLNGGHETEAAVYSDRKPKQICRVIDLPAEVQTARAEFDLKDGVLELALPIAFSSLRSEALSA
jgi:HSP20 family protein